MMIRVLQMSLVLLLGFVTSGIAYDVAKGRILYRVVDEEGSPVAGAVFTGAGWIPDESVACGFGGTTDSNGMAQIDFLTATEISGEFNKTNYYRSDFHHEFGAHVGYPISNGCWQPYPLRKEIELKRIRKPIAMYVKRVEAVLPVMGQPVGYDLVKGDWVLPFGSGENGDFVISAAGEFRSVFDAEINMTVSFHRSGDGILIETITPVRKGRPLGSILVSCHDAPYDGYLQQYSYIRRMRPSASEQINMVQRRNQMAYFRVRSESGEGGKLLAAHYGKIYGDVWAYFANKQITVAFHYYLNPTPSDRNMEFDPEQNLMPHKGPKYMHPRFAP